MAWDKLRGTQCLAFCVYLAKSFSRLNDCKCGAMEKTLSTASAAILVMGLIVNLNAYAEKKEEVANQSLFFGCLPVKVPPKKSFLSELDWVGCIDEKLRANAPEKLDKENKNQWGFWNCETK